MDALSLLNSPDFLPNSLFDPHFSGIPSCNFADMTVVNTLARNFYLLPDCKTSDNKPTDDRHQLVLGVWHVLPNSTSQRLISENKTSPQDMAKSLGEDDEPVMVFFHGRGTNRATQFRFYNIMTGMNFHVLAIDYRGFGDSTGEPTEDGLNDDSHAIYKYAREMAPNKEIIVFGQSLGTAVGAAMVRDLSKEGKPPRALILTAAMCNVRDVFVLTLTNATGCSVDSVFNASLDDAMKRANLKFETDCVIKGVECPILIIANTHDFAVPNELSRKLRDSALAANRNVTYVEISDPSAGHAVHMSSQLPAIIQSFLREQR
ncbi:serine aminopeptidase, s33 domain-containing protein [Ditylenchus destructor]|uniref:Serine aminopeptidase, s33 domain-containing protein n=1 Tax=Ditylenchus destructor TaxID=166010 RepID=A0AAD4QYD3_9BILA|nr:serine aminopeptidase, s33 domain-containing protein [Ditylenchus destructor]